MKMCISFQELSLLKARALVPLECENCNNIFRKGKNNVLTAIKGHPDFALRFCSLKCYYASQIKKNWIDIQCAECGKLVNKQVSKIKDNKFSFCSKSCSAKFQNKHNTLGKSRKSKAETYLVKLIQEDFKDLEIKENVRNVLPSNLEIDIYIPAIKSAIEVNGLLHYFPIFGKEKLQDIKNKDKQKALEAKEVGCYLTVVNISQIKYWKETKIYLDNEYKRVIKPRIESLITLNTS